MRERRREKDVLASWAGATRPTDQYRWPMTPDMNRLDDLDSTNT
jgi:hypothetical protein